MTNKTETAGSLDTFAFDDSETWFGQEAPKTTSDVIAEVKSQPNAAGKVTEIKQGTTVDEDGEIEDEEEVSFFGSETKEKPVKKKVEAIEEEETEEEEKEETVATDTKDDKNSTEEVDDSKFFTTLAGELKEKGVFQNVEIPENEEITEEKFFELQEKEIQARTDEGFEAFFGEMDEDGKAFLKFKREGGNTADFFNHIGSNLNMDEYNPEDSNSTQKVLVHYLTTVEGLEGEELTDKLTWLKDGGKEKKYAQKYFDTLKAEEQAGREALIKAQSDAVKARTLSTENYNTALKETISKTDKVGEVLITKQDQKDLDIYFTKATTKVGKNRFIPQFQADIAKVFKGETVEDRQKLVLLGKLLKTNFDLSGIKKAGKTEAVKESKTKLQDAKRTPKTTSVATGVGSGAKSMADFF